MYTKTFHHTLPDGSNAKFTILPKIIEGKTYYTAHVIGTDLDIYKKLSIKEQELEIGMQITDGKRSTIYYSDAGKLESDILTKYGSEWLNSEK